MGGDRIGPVFSALSDPNRRHLVEALARCETATLSELAAELPITRQAVSKHLTALTHAGLVSASRSGRHTHFRLTPTALDVALAWMERVGADWEERLQALRAHLTGEPR